MVLPNRGIPMVTPGDGSFRGKAQLAVKQRLTPAAVIPSRARNPEFVVGEIFAVAQGGDLGAYGLLLQHFPHAERTKQKTRTLDNWG